VGRRLALAPRLRLLSGKFNEVDAVAGIIPGHSGF
jgi:hypothetical protein